MNAPKEHTEVPKPLKEIPKTRLIAFLNRAEGFLEEIYRISVYKTHEEIQTQNLGRRSMSLWNQYQSQLQNLFEETDHAVPEAIGRPFGEIKFFLFEDPVTFGVQVNGQSFFLPGSSPESELREFAKGKDPRVLMNHFGMLACQSLAAIRQQKEALEKAPKPSKTPKPKPAKKSAPEQQAETVQAVEAVVTEPVSEESVAKTKKKKFSILSSRESRELGEIQRVLIEQLQRAHQAKNRENCLIALRGFAEETDQKAVWKSFEEYRKMLGKRYRKTNVNEEVACLAGLFQKLELEYKIWMVEIPIFARKVTQKSWQSVQRRLESGCDLEKLLSSGLKQLRYESGVCLTAEGLGKLERCRDNESFFLATQGILYAHTHMLEPA